MNHILWKWLDRPGHDSARVIRSGDSWQLDGSAVFVENSQPVRLEYRVLCDRDWKSRSASVAGWVGETAIDVDISVNDTGEWLLNGHPQPDVAGCIDVDLNFSPSTNLLPIRRLELAVGEERPVRAAWLRFPSFRLEVLEQTYRRLAEHTYEYESAGGSFKAQLQVNDFGFPTAYGGVWEMEAST